MTGAMTPGREPETWYRGKMRPRSEVEQIKREEAAAMAGPVVVTARPPEAPHRPRQPHQAQPTRDNATETKRVRFRWEQCEWNTTPPRSRHLLHP